MVEFEYQPRARAIWRALDTSSFLVWSDDNSHLRSCTFLLRVLLSCFSDSMDSLVSVLSFVRARPPDNNVSIFCS